MSNKINDGGPAFPEVRSEDSDGIAQPVSQDGNRGDAYIVSKGGMSVRTWLAGRAMTGILSQSPSGFFTAKHSLWEACWNKAREEDGDTEQFAKVVAAMSRLFADKLIEELEETNEESTPSHGESFDAQA